MSSIVLRPSTKDSSGASLYRRTGSLGQSLRRTEDRLVCLLVRYTTSADNLDKAREVFQTALEFFGDEEEQIEKAQVCLITIDVRASLTM